MLPLVGLKLLLRLRSARKNMASKHQDRFPNIPTSLNAGGYEMRDFSFTESERAVAHTDPRYTPYLGLRARLSQTWLNKWTILLLLVLCRVLLAVKGLNGDIQSAKAQALSACTSVENVGSAMASMPHYMSQGVNAMAAAGVTDAYNGLMQMLMLTVTGIEEIVLFVINMMTSTYVCLITLVVTGSLHVAIEMIEDVGNFMNKSISGITSGISSDISSFQNDLNSFLSGLSSVTGLFGGSKNPPSIDLSSQISALNSIQIDPSQMDSDLTKLNNSIPTFAQVQNFTDNVIRLPFEEIKSLINSSMSGYTFDQSVFPVADKQSLTFCSDNDGINDFFDGLTVAADTARKVFIAVMIILAIACCFPMAYREIWRWRSMKQRAVLMQKNSFDSMDVIYIASRPISATVGIKAASRFQSSKRQILIRWFIAYITSVPALLVLALGLAGLFSCLCQYILLRTIEHEVPILANEVGNFADTVVNALNTASAAWATSANDVINSTNTQVNNDVFGWVNTSTTAINDTLNAFVDNTTSILNSTFGGTILYDPIIQTLNCLVFLKVAGIEKGLTWVQDHAHITFPEFANDTFSLGAAASLTNNNASDSFLSSPGSSATDDITGAVDTLVAKMASGIQDEAIIATCLVGIWLFLVLLGLIRILLAMASRDKTRGEGAGLTGDNRPPLSPRTPTMTRAGDVKLDSGDAPKVYVVDEDYDDTWSGKGSHGLGIQSGGEKLGVAGQRAVPSPERKAHVRSSSYGYVAEGNNRI